MQIVATTLFTRRIHTRYSSAEECESLAREGCLARTIFLFFSRSHSCWTRLSSSRRGEGFKGARCSQRLCARAKPPSLIWEAWEEEERCARVRTNSLPLSPSHVIFFPLSHCPFLSLAGAEFRGFSTETSHGVAR